MLIHITNQDKKVVFLWSHDGILTNFRTTVEANMGSDALAILTADKMREELKRSIKAISSEAYEQGYRDGRAKRAKRVVHRSWP